MEVEEDQQQGQHDDRQDLPQTKMDVVFDDANSDQSCNERENSIICDNDRMKAANKRISDELLRLSSKDRNTINEEIHGVRCHSRNETPEMLRSSLANLSVELYNLIQLDKDSDISTSSLSAGYVLSGRGSFDGSTYVNNPGFRLRFLRCEDFDAKKAAIRLMRFMNLMLEVFGAFALFRPIKLTDFKRCEIQILQSGWMQILPFRDRSGRKVFIWIGEMGFQYDSILRIKIAIYLFLAGTQDVETQLKGVVCVSWPIPSSSLQSSFGDKKEQLAYCSLRNRSMMALPVNVRAFHYCLLCDKTRILGILQRTLCTNIARTTLVPQSKLSFGTEDELRNSLSSYGIPVTVIPLTNSGCIKTSNLKQWLKFQRRLDEIDPATARASLQIDCPGSNDVVFRSGSTMITNPGNVKFRSLIESKILELYSNSDGFSTPKRKEDVAIEIMKEILHRKGGRFLGWDNENFCWKEFKDLDHVKAKVAIAYRDLKLKTQKSIRINNSKTWSSTSGALERY